MQQQNTKEILEKLHNSYGGLPRLEIGDMGEYNPTTLYISGLHRLPEERRKQVVYVLKDYHSEAGGDSEYDYDYIQFPKLELEKLIGIALESESQEATISCTGRRTIHKEWWHHYSGASGEGPKQTFDISLQLSLKITDREPSLSIEYQNNH